MARLFAKDADGGRCLRAPAPAPTRPGDAWHIVDGLFTCHREELPDGRFEALEAALLDFRLPLFTAAYVHANRMEPAAELATLDHHLQGELQRANHDEPPLRTRDLLKLREQLRAGDVGGALGRLDRHLAGVVPSLDTTHLRADVCYGGQAAVRALCCGILARAHDDIGEILRAQAATLVPALAGAYATRTLTCLLYQDDVETARRLVEGGWAPTNEAERAVRTKIAAGDSRNLGPGVAALWAAERAHAAANATLRAVLAP